MSRHFTFLVVIFLGVLSATSLRADTYQLKDGQTVGGDFVSADETGVVLKLGENKYSERISWNKFSQSDLKVISQKNAKAAQFVEPFIELTQDEKIQRKAITIHEVPRPARPVPGSLIGAMLTSGIGLFLSFMMYLANLYAAFEISIYRGRPAGLVCGVAAVAPVIGPIIFLSMPTKLRSLDVPHNVPEEEILPEAPPEEYADGGAAPAAPDAGGLHIAHAGAEAVVTPEAVPPAAAHTPTMVYERGQFIFNRRFIETKFADFLGVVPRAAEGDMVVMIKSARGEFTGRRISEITASELRFQVDKGQASEEVIIPFMEINQMQLKHKDA